MVSLDEASLPVEDLLLDPNNYRFQESRDFSSASPARFGEESVQARAASRIRDEGISELKQSILHNGFLPFERIVVRRYDDTRYLVIEGNRRVAALKWIERDHQAGVDVPSTVLDTLKAVPVIVATGVEDDPALPLALMGVRHVGGIKPWGGFQRAKLVTELRDDHGFDTGDVAARLGMTSHEVNRRYRAFKALLQMMRDEEYGDVAEPDMYPLFHEAVAGSAVKEWLDWDDEAFEFRNNENLHTFYDLITSRTTEDGAAIPAKVTTREAVRDLREILPLPEARRVLLDAESTYTDALAIAKADSLAKSWVTQVGEAVVALKSVGALELKRLSEEDLSEVRALAELARELLETHALFQTPAPQE